MSNTVKLPTCPKCGLPIPKEAPQGLCPKCVLLGAATATEQGVPATATSEIPSLERIARAFPQLEILELIGRGGMGFVFKARQPHLDRFVALKLLPDKLAKDPQFAERFNREGRVLARLNHPNIVSVYDFGQTGGFYYLTMEYVDGVNLRQAMRAGRFSPSEALAIVPKICEALQYAHDQGILHRDIKPENILLDAKGRVKIADFGIAKLVGDDAANITLTNTGAALGTPHYMAPEQLEKPATVDHRADIYSLGVVFYEMLTGELPIGRFAAPSSKTPVNTTVDDVVFRTLEKDRDRRFQSAGEMKTQVEYLGTGAKVSSAYVEAPHEVQTARSYSRRSIYGALCVGISLLLLLLLAVVAHLGRSGMGGWEILLFALLGGLPGGIMGLQGLNEIRDSGGRVRGLPLAVFAALFWPLVVSCGLAVRLPVIVFEQFGEPTLAHTVGRALVLILPAAVIAFSLWTIHATIRWAGGQPPAKRRGVLKWVFIGVLSIGVGLVMSIKPVREVHYTNDASAVSEVPVESTETQLAPMIQFTFTSVELREEAGARWLAMDYVEQIRGDCRHTFRYNAQVAGFTGQTRMDSFLSEGKAGFAPVLHQRVMWKLPDSLSRSDALALRDEVAKEWVGKSAAIGPDNERLLFEASVPDGGTLAAAFGVKLNSDGSASRTTRKVAAPPSQDAASAELWSPELAGGEKANVSEILQEAKRLADAGRFEEALQRHIWYHNHALEIEPGQVGVRLSFALSYWAELARRYPKALEALSEIRDRGTAEFEQGGGYFELFQEVSAINRELNDADATLALFNSIDARDSQLARQCYFGAEDLLVERGEYALCARHIGNFQERFLHARDARTRLSSILDRTPGLDRSKMRRDGDNSFIKTCRQLVEILVGLERKSEAVAIRDQATAVLNVPELRSAVEDAESRTERVRQSLPKGASSGSSTLEFRLVADDADSVSPIDELAERQRDGSETRHRVLRTIVLDGSAVAHASTRTDPNGGVVISVELSSEGARQLGAITSANIGRRLAVVSHGSVLSAPLIRSAISGGQLNISGVFSAEEANNLVTALNRQPESWKFGPVVLRKLSFFDNFQDGFLSFKIGTVLTPPKDVALLFKTDYAKRLIWENVPEAATIRMSMSNWLHSSGANLMAWGGQHPERLELCGGVAIQPPWNGTNRAGFDETDPGVVAKQAETFLRPLLTNNTARPQLIQPGYDPKLGQRQDTFQFLTREGIIGVLQILHTVDNPPGLQIRYKLVQPSTVTTP